MTPKPATTEPTTPLAPRTEPLSPTASPTPRPPRPAPGLEAADRSDAPVTLSAGTIAALASAISAAFRPATPRLLLTPREAAASLGVSRDFFDDRVKPELRLVRRGSLVLVPVAELERWVERTAARALS